MSKDKVSIVRMSSEERALFEKAAGHLGLSLSAFLRMAAIKHAQAVLREFMQAKNGAQK
jgi:uncharacterized protein (DUF1778 family)